MTNDKQVLNTSKTANFENSHNYKLPIPASNSKLALFDAIPDLILVLNRDGILFDYNKPTNFEYCLSLESLLGKSTLGNVFPAEYGQKPLKYIQSAIDKGIPQIFNYQAMQNACCCFFECRFVQWEKTKVFAIIRDITDTTQLINLSKQDVLTGVNNRACFEDKIADIRGKKNINIGILVCDVDCLKLINDTLGHRAGDELLKAAANILRTHLPFPAVIARIGGDEFAILTTKYQPHQLNETVARIMADIADYNENTAQIPANLSIGWATNFETNKSIDELFQIADNNMYLAKIRQRGSTHATLIKILEKSLSTKDYVKDGHADRLQILVERLAQKLQLSSRRIDDLKLFAKFHDIGIVGIPESILAKPDRLTSDEESVIRRHSEIGFHIAKSVPDLAPIANLILSHQEWWNGQGYPLGLKGEEIPLECRILAIADAYDAMINHRPYRQSLSPTKAIEQLKLSAGKQFDLGLTELFIELLLANR